MTSEPAGPDKIRCPRCDQTNARTLIRLAPMVYVRCRTCDMIWTIADRRRPERLHLPGGELDEPEVEN